MAKDRVIWDLAVTLQDLLTSELALPDARPVAVTVDTPGDVEAERRPLMFVTLYELEENVQGRRMEKVLTATVEEDGDLYEYYGYPPLPVFVRFLITCAGRSREEEHRLLGQCLRIIHDHPVLQGPGVVKGDSLAPDEKVYLSVRSSWCIERQSRFWLATGEKFRPSIGCQFSINVESERRDRVVRVKERVVDVKRSISSSS